ncbi:TPA: stage VI sporulation protein F [Candidatus Avacholeplasma faecigallinarum]|nr:stage VI sporulation protein F [Candidatus Avacholeplasma faecigallinarum]
MDFRLLIDMLAKANINSEKIYDLVKEASSLDLSKEENQRILIREGAKLANKNLTKEMEDKIILILKEKGISSDLLNYVK